MKIVITSDIYYPMVNGVAMFAYNLASGLARRGHEVAVICPSFTGEAKRVVDPESGVVVYHLKSVRFPFYPDQINQVTEGKAILGRAMPRLAYKNGLWISPYPYPELRKILQEIQPDVVHNQTAEMISLATVWYARKYGVPLVSTGHAYPDNLTSQLRILKPIKRPLDAVLRAYMASFLKNSEYATMPTEVAIDDLVPKRRRRFKVVEALSNGVDLERFVPGERPGLDFFKKYGIDPKLRVILHVGRVDPEKSIERVVRAFWEVRQEREDVQLVVVGDGTERERLTELARELGISEVVHFVGRVMGADLIEFYRMGEVFVTASETETQGLVLVEAAAMGLPLVAVDAGAVREVCVDGVNGVLCGGVKNASGLGVSGGLSGLGVSGGLSGLGEARSEGLRVRSGVFGAGGSLKNGGGGVFGVGRRREEKVVRQLAEGLKMILKDAEKREKMGQESLVIAKGHDLNRTLARFEEIYEIAIRIKREGGME